MAASGFRAGKRIENELKRFYDGVDDGLRVEVIFPLKLS